MGKKIYKQWELPNNSKVILEGLGEVIFKKMDGMYAQWDVNGEFKIGNFEGFVKNGNNFEVIN